MCWILPECRGGRNTGHTGKYMARADGGRDGLGVSLRLSGARRGGDGDGDGVVPRAGLPRQKEHELTA